MFLQWVDSNNHRMSNRSQRVLINKKHIGVLRSLMICRFESESLHLAYCSVLVLSTSLCCQSLPLRVRVRGTLPFRDPGVTPTRGPSGPPPRMDEAVGAAPPVIRAEAAAEAGRDGSVVGAPLESPSVLRLCVKSVELGGATVGGSKGRPIRIEVSAALCTTRNGNSLRGGRY